MKNVMGTTYDSPRVDAPRLVSVNAARRYSATMPAIRPRRPRLLRLGDTPTIVGHRCTSCSRVAFPPDPYGCEQCGATADALADIELQPTGTITALATVHRHHRPQPEVPFTVATITLDAGVSLKGVLLSGEAASVGDRVRGVLVPYEIDDDGIEVVDLQFERVGDDGGAAQ